MVKILSAFIFIFFVPYQLRSQILPKEGSKLNYRLIGFSFPGVPKVSEFKIEISGGNYNNEDSFKQNIIQTIRSKNNKIIAEVPSFGRQYTWRTVYSVNSAITTSELHHFNTSFAIEVDTNKIRLRIIKSAEKYKDAYVFLDGNRALYDMEGHPVWYLPDADRFNASVNDLQPSAPKNITAFIQQMLTPTEDLKLTPQGTITFLYNYMAYEVDYNGTVLWKGPDYGSGNIQEPYHREFTRLADGHYMALESVIENVHWAWAHTSANDSNIVFVPANEMSGVKSKIYNDNTEFGVVTEYDGKGNVLWSWNSSKYFLDYNKGVDLRNCETQNPSSDRTVHDNSFFFDEKDSAIYVSFRNVSRVIKLKYPTGAILNAYGNYNQFTEDEARNSLFCYQHCCRKSDKGYLYLFNNNLCNAGDMPKITLLQEPILPGENLKKIWEYSCTIETQGEHEREPIFRSGGSVMELPDQSIFACMGRDYSKVFIVSRDKKIIWSAMPEMWDRMDRKWDMIHQYRASIVLNRKELERMIWDGEENK